MSSRPFFSFNLWVSGDISEIQCFTSVSLLAELVRGRLVFYDRLCTIWLETQRCVSSQVYFKPFWKEESNAAPGHSLHLYLSLRRKKLMSISSFFIQISVPPSNYLSVCLSVSLSFDQLLLLTPTSPAPSTSYFLILQVFQDWWQTSQNNSSKKKNNDPLSDSVELFAVVWREEKKKEKESMCPVFRTVPGSHPAASQSLNIRINFILLWLMWCVETLMFS